MYLVHRKKKFLSLPPLRLLLENTIKEALAYNQSFLKGVVNHCSQDQILTYGIFDKDDQIVL